MSLSYDNLPRWNDYIPSKEIKDTQKSKGIFPNYKMIDFSTISKMSQDTLFFIFYFFKGEM
jgi:CCR4-NOT transcriptional regulation complex NOT5 subunit